MRSRTIRILLFDLGNRIQRNNQGISADLRRLDLTDFSQLSD